MSVVSVVGEIDRAMNALADIKRLHLLVTVCAGCHNRQCPGDCHWADELDDDPHTVAVCSACCWDDRDNADQLVNDLTNWLNTQTTGDPQ